ncbi:hypothetical protein SNE40_016511 [Patella caerulea]|uniref:Uncharacterized protein n=2 Tax=Patella caerulea TaxID=87958 RepID=A0AAN8PDJ1_PATCE
MKVEGFSTLLVIFSSYKVCEVHCSQKMKNMTSLLDGLLHGYDKRVRPYSKGGPVTVNADILLRSMGPISELEMSYSLDCYFRQTWVDKRLSMNISLENVSLGIKILERIWHPDTVFYNGHNSYLHIITTPNKFLRISPDGGILYSQRLTIRANCMMNLKKFPLDVQQCPLRFGSFAYSTADVFYKWRAKLTSPVDIYPHLTLSTFDLIGYPMTNYTDIVKGELHSILAVKFYLRRHAGYFIIQVYVPCALLVVLSWVSFWINREATADRIALGTTTTLTMTILGIENRNDFPKVSYITALDLYIAVCFVFVLATTVEFAIVHSFTKYGTGEPFLAESTDDEESEEENMNLSGKCDLEVLEMERMKIEGHNKRRSKSFLALLCQCLTGTKTGFNRVKTGTVGLHDLSNSVSQIDKVSRVLFPAIFIVLNLIYWFAYMP